MIGKTIAHYEILEKLGEGGMGVVYKARDTRLDRLVALKFLPQGSAVTPDERERFLREARAASALNHPNVCHINAIVEERGIQFIDMELVDGVTLRERVPIPDLRLAIDIAVQTGGALEEAHRNSIVHRDIKCDNIMLTSRNLVKVMDFGLAKLKGSMALTRSSSTVGTAAYMAPEVIRGEQAEAAADVFSFGVVLYEMLTGAKPFRGDHEAAVMYSIMNEDPKPVMALRSDCPPLLDEIVRKMLQKLPAERYQHAGQIVADLKNLGIAGPGLSSSPPAAASRTPPPDSGVISIAVLAFEDMSPEKDQDYLCEGLAEEIINALTKIKTLRVSARTSAFAFKGKRVDVREIGSKLNVQNVLEGSIRKSGNRLRITAQLINVDDGYHKWSERYDRELRDVFEIQDEMTENIVRALKVMLTEKEKASLEVTSTSSVEAFEYYLRGRRLFHQHLGAEEQAIQMFTRATEIDPGYADAYCGLADCYTFIYLYDEATEEALRKAESASRKAIELRPDLAEAHTSLAFILGARKQYEAADQEFEKAVRLNPRHFEAWFLWGRTCFARGDYERTAKYYQEATQLNPEDFQAAMLLSDVYRSLNNQAAYRLNLQNAIQRGERYLELNPDDVRALYMCAGAYIQLGQPGRGEPLLERAMELEPESTAVLYNVACGYSNLGKIDHAIDLIEKALENGFAHKEWLEHDGDLNPLRSHPRFQALLASMKS